MKIPKETKEQWRNLRQQGDITAIEKASDISRNTIAAAFESEECTIEVFEAIKKYYAPRIAKLEKLLK